MMLKKFTLLVFCIICFLMFNGCSEKNTVEQNEVVLDNLYNFDDVDMSEFEGDGFSIEEYKETLEKNKNMPDTDEYNKVLIVVHGKEVRKNEFESQKNLLKLRNDDVSNKAVAYSIIKNIVLEFEAQRLNIVPQTDSIEEHINDIKNGFETGEGMEYVYIYMESKGYTEEDYIKECMENDYKMWCQGELYRSANKNGDYENIDEYVKDLIKKADIKIYDSKLAEECS